MQKMPNCATITSSTTEQIMSNFDQPVTNAELDQFYGKDKPHAVRDEIIETLTKTIRTAPITKIGVPYIHYSASSQRLGMMPIPEVLTDYGMDKGPMSALLDVLAKSDCPLVEAYRMALAKRYADAWADDVESLSDAN